MNQIKFTSTIVKGKQLGRNLGFPTANLDMSSVYTDTLETGVFAGLIQIENSETIFKTAVSVGRNLTFNQKNYTVEAYILDFNADIYGKKVKLVLYSKIREMQKFETVESLVEAIKSDVEQVKNWVPDQQIEQF